MRVLHIHSGNLYGGVETFLITLVREARLAPDMSSTFAVCFDGRLRRELVALDARILQLPSVRLSRPDTLLRARRALKQFLEREPFEVVVCHQPWTCAVFGGSVRDAGFPLVLWLHMAGDGRHWLERLARRTRPDLAICNSRFSAMRASRWLPDTRSALVYYPVSRAHSADPGGERLSLRSALTTQPDDVVIVQVSRLEAWKGHGILLEALAQLRDVSSWTCWITGGSQRPGEVDYLQELRNSARVGGILDRVRFIGERNDVPAVLRAADIFCQPNIEPEPFGLSLVEALEAGLPVVTSGVGGACEIVDESCGILIPPGDVVALASALRRTVTDVNLRTRLGTAAPQRPSILCDPARQMRQIRDVLSSVVRPQLSSISL